MSQEKSKRNYKRKYQQKPTKKANKVLAYGFSKDTSSEVPVETKKLDRLRNSWIPFGDDNLFPQQLAELSRSASTHRAILNTKTTFTIGEGFSSLDEKLVEYIDDVNANGESMNDVMKKVVSDFWTHGNAYVEIVLGAGYINLYHQDATTARVHKGKKKILFHPDWANVRTSEEKIKSIETYPNFQKEGKIKRAVVHFSDYESTYFFYGLPDYVAALDHIKIANQIGKYNLTRFKNGFMPSAIIELGADMSEDEAQQFIDEAREIISAHRWNPSLSGIQVAGSLGNNQQILTIYDIVMSTVIREPQQMILRELKKILKREGGYKVSDLHIINKPPVTMLGAINPTEYISLQEGRKIFHLPELTEEEMEQLLQEKNKVKDGTDNSDTSN